MTYRKKPSNKEHARREKKPYRLAGYNTLKRLYGYDAIDMDKLFEHPRLRGEVAKKKGILEGVGRLIRRFYTSVKSLAKRIGRAIKILAIFILGSVLRIYRSLRHGITCLVQKIAGRKRSPYTVPILSGALVGVLVLGVLSALSVLYSLLFSEYYGRYKKTTVPDMVGKNYYEAIEALEKEYYNITVSYEYSSSVPKGRVISQTPTGGVERKVFAGGELCQLSISVSRGNQTFLMKDYRNMRSRDAELELKNAAFSVAVIEEFSDTVASGEVIYTTPSEGRIIEAGALAVLHVSLGKKVSSIRVPNICGMSESAAVNRLLSAGFVVGDISYKSSSQKVGTVISQSISHTSRAKSGSMISFCVSAGQKFDGKIMPSLYGMSIDEAKRVLSQYGLVAGNIYAVKSTEPYGTVISQSPAAGEEILPSLVGVDMYVSSSQ